MSVQLKEVEVPVAQVVLSTDCMITTDEKLAKYEARATSLRRAATALLFFSIVSSRPWPSAGWIGAVAAFVVLCASSQRLLCRARLARFLSALAIIFAGITLVHLATSIHANKAHRIGEEIGTRCASMPTETFEWVRETIISEHECARKAISFVSYHMTSTDADKVSNKVTLSTVSNLTDMATLVGTEPSWSQPIACDMVAYVTTRAVKMMMVGSSLAHLFLLLSAMAVFKRACCLRCAAYKAGLLKWNKCGACTKYKTAVESAADVTSAKVSELA